MHPLLFVKLFKMCRPSLYLFFSFFSFSLSVLYKKAVEKGARASGRVPYIRTYCAVGWLEDGTEGELASKTNQKEEKRAFVRPRGYRYFFLLKGKRGGEEEEKA